jgi:N-methylhydantoinase B
MSAISARDYDPVTAEVIGSRIRSIVSEAAITIIRTSGSPVITESQDFSTALFDADGEHVGYSGYVVTHIGSSLVGVQSVMRDFPRDELRRGDQFICNCPYTAGAIHQGDVGIISPLFHDEELVGWAFSNAHVLDIGGMSPGGWAPVAWDRYAEALNFPPTRFVEGGRMRDDWARFLMNNVRLPGPVMGDLKSLVAANIATQRRLDDLIAKYGLDDYRRYCEINKDLSEAALRERIARLPDGVYRSEDWVEYDGHGEDKLVHIRCEVTVAGDELRVDFSGSDPQYDGFGNAGWGATLGVMAAMVMITLAHDLPMNAGILRPLTVIAGEEGTVLNPTIPAPVSCGHMEGATKGGRAFAEALVQALQLSGDQWLESRTAGLGTFAWPGNSWTGMSQHGAYTAFAVMDCGSCGMGAQSTGDGLDISSYEVVMNCSIPDIETNEELYPMLYLWRRLNVGSGGPGLNRGGNGLDLAWVPWNTDGLVGTLENACAEVPSQGVLGGYPGDTNRYLVVRDAGVEEILAAGTHVPGPEDLASGAVEQTLNHVAGVALGPTDVFHQVTGGGAGWKDPLLREPERVEADVRAGYLTEEQALRAYGVVMADAEETDRRRAAIRAERLGREPTAPAPAAGDRRMPLLRRGSGEIACGCCDEPLGSAWRENAALREIPLSERLAEMGLFAQRRDDPVLVLREFFCPGCATCLHTQVQPQGAPIADDGLVAAQAGVSASENA